MSENVKVGSDRRFHLTGEGDGLKHTGPTVGHLKHLRRLRRIWGTNLLDVFSCVGSFWNRTDVVCSDSTCKVWERWLSAVWAIGFSDWLRASCMTILIGGCASESAWCVGGILCSLCFSMHSVPSFPVFMCWSMRLAPPAVKEAYCISRKCRTYVLLWSWQHVDAVCFNATFLPNGSDGRQRSSRGKAVGCW